MKLSRRSGTIFKYRKTKTTEMKPVMSNISHYNRHSRNSFESMLKQVFEWYENNEVTEEQVQRVLTPVVDMIVKRQI